MSNPFITKLFHFCAAHQYGHADWSEARNLEVFGPDARVHGHNYTLEVTVTGPVDPETGFCVNLDDLQKIVHRHVLEVLDHSRFERDVPWFRDRQPSSENLVVFIWEQIEKHLQGPRLHRIRLRETPTIYTDYYGRSA